MRIYEGMFLFDPTAAAEWSNVETEIGRLMERAGAELLVSKKWDERRLGYEIKGRNRGCYVLTYFKASPDKITGIERDVQLSDQVLRCLVLRADHVSEEKMNELTPAEGAATRSLEGDGTRPMGDNKSASPKSEKPVSAETAPAKKSAEKPSEKVETVPAEKPAEKPADQAEAAAETAESS